MAGLSVRAVAVDAADRPSSSCWSFRSAVLPRSIVALSVMYVPAVLFVAVLLVGFADTSCRSIVLQGLLLLLLLLLLVVVVVVIVLFMFMLLLLSSICSTLVLMVVG